jgi:hypothetical protein
MIMSEPGEQRPEEPEHWDRAYKTQFCRKRTNDKIKLPSSWAVKNHPTLAFVKIKKIVTF